MFPQFIVAVRKIRVKALSPIFSCLRGGGCDAWIGASLRRCGLEVRGGQPAGAYRQAIPMVTPDMANSRARASADRRHSSRLSQRDAEYRRRVLEQGAPETCVLIRGHGSQSFANVNVDPGQSVHTAPMGQPRADRGRRCFCQRMGPDEHDRMRTARREQAESGGEAQRRPLAWNMLVLVG